MKKLIAIFFLMISVCAVVNAQEITLPEKPDRPEYIDYSSRQSGFFAAAQITPSVLFGNGLSAYYLTQLDFVAGYRVNEFLKVGFGVSPKFGFADFSRTISYLPLYVDIRGNFISQQDRMYSPYWNLDVGYTLNAGFLVAPTFGFKFGSVRNNFLVGIGYTCQNFAEAKYYVHGMVLRLGYEF